MEKPLMAKSNVQYVARNDDRAGWDVVKEDHEGHQLISIGSPMPSARAKQIVEDLGGDGRVRIQGRVTASTGTAIPVPGTSPPRVTLANSRANNKIV
jgi:hypothetical protein